MKLSMHKGTTLVTIQKTDSMTTEEILAVVFERCKRLQADIARRKIEKGLT